MAFLECFQADFYHKQSRELLCLQVNGVSQSILVLNLICTVSKLRSRVNLQVHFQFSFGIFFPSVWRAFSSKYSKWVKTEVALNMEVFLHNMPLYWRTGHWFWKVHNVESTHSSHKHIYLLQPFKCRAKSTLFTIFHCYAGGKPHKRDVPSQPGKSLWLISR